MRSLISEHARHSPARPPPFSGRETPSRRRIPKENVYAGTAPPSVDPYRSPSSVAKPLGDVTPTLNRTLPPRPHKRKLDVSPAAGPRPEAEAADSGVQVVVRIRPPCSEEGEEAPVSCLCKTSANSVAIQGQSFTFDAVADAASTQEASKSLVGMLRSELESEKKCSKEALEAAMQAYSRLLARYADLEGKYILDGVEDQLNDTSEAPGELLLRLKEAEEAIRVAERRALLAEQKTDRLIEENVALNQRLTEKSEHRSLEVTRSTDLRFWFSGWFSGYDRCNI